MDNLQERFWSKVVPEPMSGCWLWIGAWNRQGYGQFKFRHHQTQTHRVAWFLTHDIFPTQSIVMHTCDVPSCVNPAHLRLGTCAENSADMVRKHRQARHERNSHAKLTWDQVEEIRQRYQAGTVTQAALSREYGVTDVMISCIVNGKNWRR